VVCSGNDGNHRTVVLVIGIVMMSNVLGCWSSVPLLSFSTYFGNGSTNGHGKLRYCKGTIFHLRCTSQTFDYITPIRFSVHDARVFSKGLKRPPVCCLFRYGWMGRCMALICI
jgi:hypothetical protein